METATTKLTKAPHNNRFNALPNGQKSSSKREKGERLEDRGNGTAALFIDGKFIAIIAN